MKLQKKKKNRGFSLAEMLITVAIIVILMAIGIPALINIQRNLRQKELDAKAEVIYTAVQNKLSKMKAGGNTAVFQLSGGSNGVAPLNVVPGDAVEDIDHISANDICYITSASLSVANTAASIIMDNNTLDESLLQNHWVIEYNPASAVVYAVFYSEDRENCASEYVDKFQKYDYQLRYKENRLDDGAKVGYYGGGSAAASSTVTTLTPSLTIVNAETLTANISCTVPTTIGDYPVFKVEMEDTAGHKYTKYYAFWGSDSEYMDAIRAEAGTNEVDNSVSSMQKAGRTFTLSLTLDDLSEDATRFVNLYGTGSGHKTEEQLQAGTPLKITVTAMCPGNYKITQNLSDTKVTNSLFADDNSKDPASSESSPLLNTQYGTASYPAIILYGRHLQNLDESSGAVNTVKYAEQGSDITFADNAGQTGVYDWYETYSGKFYNGIIDGVPNFKPITNTSLVSYNGASETTAYRIMNLTEKITDAIPAEKRPAGAGLFAVLKGGQTVKNVTLTGASVKSTISSIPAGALAGKIEKAEDGTQEVTIEHCQVYLTASDIQGKSNHDVWISGKTAGGLIGEVSSGKVSVKESSASTVVGEHTFNKGTSKVTSFAAESVGGLIGAITDAAVSVSLTESYADSYLVGKIAGGLVGKIAGGLVGKSSGAVAISSCYAAGFATYESEGAGLICGPADMTDSYTVLHRLYISDDTLPYYSTAKDGSVSGHVYYAATSTPTEKNLGESIGALTIGDMVDKLGAAFKTGTSDSTPYNLMGQALSTYTYPVLKNVPHYGDWDATFQVGALVYYEVYNDGTYGFYGANVDSTLKNDPNLTVIGDGYGIVYKQGEGNLPSMVYVKVLDDENTLYNEPLQIARGTSYPVTASNGEQYSIYPLNKELVNTDKASAKYYVKAEIQLSATETDYYYFNPHFAKTVVYLTDADAAAPALNADSRIAVRTARHLYMVSKHYDTYANVTQPCTFLQERNIAYTSYEWTNYSTRTDKTTSQSPIAGGATAFKAVYDGQCNWITDVSFTTETGQYVGFIGHNEGTIRNVVLRASYEEGSDANYYVGRSGDVENNQTVYMGVLTGQNETGGRISNCAVAGYYIAGSDGTIHAYQNSLLYAGGMVGANAGAIEKCAADTPTLRLSSNYASVSLGGFAGYNSGTINDCYALGHIEVAFAKGGSVSIGGFAGKNSAVIKNSYCATALTASGETTIAYGFSPAGGSVANCQYLNGGTYSYVSHMHSFNFDKSVGTATFFSKLRVATGSAQEAVRSYDFNNTQTKTKKYPFRAVVKDADGNLVHYGDWLDDENMGTVGIFYWELETEGKNNGYRFTYMGTANGEAVGGTSLCNAHDDGGVIAEYGYGYFELNKGSVTKLNLTDAVINGLDTFSSETGIYNKTASEALESQMNLTLEDGTETKYHFYAFTTRTETSVSGDDNGNYLCMSGSTANSTWKLTYQLATGGATQTVTYEYTVSPFFANAMSCDGAKTITASDGTETHYSETPGTENNQYEIRSIQQLQFINWNNQTKNSETLVEEKTYKGQFNYLMYATIIKKNKVSQKSDITDGIVRSWQQSHDLDGTDYGNFTPIAGNYESSSASSYVAALYAWFGGNYNGESYKIKNVSIESNSFAVGLFGVTVGANINNIIMYSDNDSVITRKVDIRDDGYKDKVGAYAIGGLIGVAYDYNVDTTTNFINNCAIAGYIIKDCSTNQQGLGEANIGGLIGVANVHLKNCSAVNKIIIDTRHQKGTPKWGLYTRVGGLTGAAQGKVKNCYSGGSAVITPETLNETITTWNGSNKNEIYIGGISGSGFTSNYSNFTGNGNVIDGAPEFTDCYTYFSFPKKEQNIKLTKLQMFTIASTSDRALESSAQNARVTINNCYYYSGSKTEGVDEIYGDAKTTVNILESLTYDQMSDFETEDGLLKRLNGSPNNGTNPLSYGAGFSNVTTREGNANAVIDGKYSYPGSNQALEGKNYPFPAVIQQKDLTYSTTKNPKYVYVHYGDWPIDGPYWENGRDTMDIFQEMNTDSEYEGYATKTFYLEPNNVLTGTLTTDSFNIDSSIGKVVRVTQQTDGRYAVTIQAVNTGTTTVTLKGYTASFTLEVTANIVLGVDSACLTLAMDQTGTLKFTASSVTDDAHPDAKQYETKDQSTWTVEADNEYLVELNQTGIYKNQWSVKREDMGRTTLTVTFTYTYPNPDDADPAEFTAVTYVDILQPDTIGLSDGSHYNVADMSAEGTEITGKNTSYSVNKPMVEDADFFLYLDSETVRLDQMTIDSISVDNVLAKRSGNVYDTTTGYHIELSENVTEDELYQYLSGSIYYLTKDDNLNPKKDILLQVTISYDGKKYNLAITLSEVNTYKAITSTYEDGSGKSFSRTHLSGERSLPTQEEALAECAGFSVPTGKMLAGWKVKVSGGDDTVYAPGASYDFSEDETTFVAVFEDARYTVTLDANGGKINDNGEDKDTYDLIMSEWSTNLGVYSNKTTRKGYDLEGWKLDETKTYGKYENVETSSLSNDITLYAQWKTKSYTIKLTTDYESVTNEKWFQTIGASYDSENLRTDIGSPYETPLSNSARVTGWANANGETVISVDSDGNLSLVKNVSGYTDKDGKWIHDTDWITLTAQWKPFYTLKLYTTASNPDTLVFENPISNMSELTDYASVMTKVSGGTNRTFTGWYERDNVKNYTQIIAADGTIVGGGSLEESKELYAGWEKTYYKKVSALENGKNYLITSSGEPGDSVFALMNNNNNIASAEVKFDGDNIIGVASESVDISKCIWTCGLGTNTYTFNNSNKYLSADKKNLKISDDSMNWSVSIKNCKAEVSYGNSTTYWLAYNNNDNFGLNKHSRNVYFYEKTIVTIYAGSLSSTTQLSEDPQTDSGEASEASVLTLRPETSNQTSQMPEAQTPQSDGSVVSPSVTEETSSEQETQSMESVIPPTSSDNVATDEQNPSSDGQTAKTSVVSAVEE